MARIITDNPILRGMSGRFGDLIIRQTKNGPVICKAPDFSNYKPTAAQIRHNEKFARAAAYASAINNDPKKRKKWEAKVKKGQSVYNVILKSFMERSED